ELTERLVILNLPHPRGLMRELATNPRQQENSQYARDFQQPHAHEYLSAEGLAGWVNDEAARERYVEALGRSDFEAMVNYYKANYPREPYTEDASPVVKARMPVLMFHGLDDPYLLHDALNRTWEWLERDLTLVTIPGAGHFVQHDASALVTETMRAWLNQADAVRQ
ncbi:alpha/beta hydrolase, partial [Candidatus Poribacteria bacterium]|nr:alpha/beta hydrolase [Candidatus Poribacteria bacterium]